MRTKDLTSGESGTSSDGLEFGILCVESTKPSGHTSVLAQKHSHRFRARASVH